MLGCGFRPGGTTRPGPNGPGVAQLKLSAPEAVKLQLVEFIVLEGNSPWLLLEKKVKCRC